MAIPLQPFTFDANRSLGHANDLSLEFRLRFAAAREMVVSRFRFKTGGRQRRRLVAHVNGRLAVYVRSLSAAERRAYALFKWGVNYNFDIETAATTTTTATKSFATHVRLDEPAHFR